MIHVNKAILLLFISSLSLISVTILLQSHITKINLFTNKLVSRAWSIKMGETNEGDLWVLRSAWNC